MSKSSGDLKKLVGEVSANMTKLNTSLGNADAKFQSVARRADTVLKGSSTTVATSVAQAVQKAQKAVEAAAQSVQKAAKVAGDYGSSV